MLYLSTVFMNSSDEVKRKTWEHNDLHYRHVQGYTNVALSSTLPLSFHGGWEMDDRSSMNLSGKGWTTVLS